jgi:predicted nucleic acid-binding protein
VPVLADTSALYALLDPDDAQHRAAASGFQGGSADGADPLLTHNYVVIEAAALIQRRLGAAATRALFESLLPTMHVLFVDEQLHGQAESAYLAAPAGPSLVDCMSFQVMRTRGVREAFAFDGHFAEQGLETVP